MPFSCCLALTTTLVSLWSMNKCFLHLVSLTGFCTEAHSVEGFACDSAAKESTCSVGDLGLVPGLGRSPGEGNGYPFQYSGLENSMDCTVHEVTKSQTRLSDLTSLQYRLTFNYLSFPPVSVLSVSFYFCACCCC